MTVRGTYVELPSFNKSLGELKVLLDVLKKDQKELERAVYNISNLIKEQNDYTIDKRIAMMLFEAESNRADNESWWYEVDRGCHNWYGPCHDRYLRRARSLVVGFKKLFLNLTDEDCLKMVELFTKKGP